MMYGIGGGPGLHCLAGGFFPWMPLLFGVLLLGLAALVIVYAVKRTRPAAHSTALETLANRFAAGEITEEEFLSRKKALKG